MVKIHNNLYIGNQQDYEGNVKGRTDWCVIHACKEPYHRALLGYTGRGAPKNHPEYLIAKRESHVWCIATLGKAVLHLLGFYIWLQKDYCQQVIFLQLKMNLDYCILHIILKWVSEVLLLKIGMCT